MKSFQLLAKSIAKLFLQYDRQKLAAKLEYHYAMAQMCEEQIIANRVRLEDLETRA
jgi:hypothetical protein